MEARADRIIERLDEMAGDGGSEDECKLGQLGIFGIQNLRFLDIPHEQLVALVGEIGRPRQELAIELWKSDQYEAKILSCMLSDPDDITEEQADGLAERLDSWVLSDYFCGEILWKLPYAMRKASEWADSGSETVRCSGFNLIAAIACRDQGASRRTPGFLDNALFLARKHASDANPSVQKAVSSALTMIGKVGRDWHEAAIEAADEIAAQPSESSRWVASQALGELKSSRVTNAFREG
jgi:3-methyladenine DNA glycosylase AlkD